MDLPEKMGDLFFGAGDLLKSGDPKKFSTFGSNRNEIENFKE